MTEERKGVWGLTPEEIATTAARAADGKNAADVKVLLVGPLTVVADYFVICSGETLVQIGAIADAVEEALEAKGVLVHRREQERGSGWILLDYGSVVVHVFRDAEREYYNLERLWGDAEELDWRVDAAQTVW